MRNLRKRKADDEAGDESGDEEIVSRTVLEDTKFLQKLRVAPAGLSAQAQLEGPDTNPDEEAFGLRHRSKEGQLQDTYITEEVKDENAVDPEMEKYVETQLAKRLGREVRPQGGEEGSGQGQGYQDPEAELYRVPNQLKNNKTRTQDVAAYLTGILEVPLSLEQKLRNIEATEATKQRLLKEAKPLGPGLEADEPPPVGLQNGVPRALYPRDFGRQNDGDVARRVESVITALTTEKPNWKERRRRR